MRRIFFAVGKIKNNFTSITTYYCQLYYKPFLIFIPKTVVFVLFGHLNDDEWMLIYILHFLTYILCLIVIVPFISETN